MERPDGGPKATEEKEGTKPVHADPSAVRQEAAAAVSASTTTERSDLVRIPVANTFCLKTNLQLNWDKKNLNW